MVKSMRQMQRAVSMADCIVEVHDARIPVSGRNKNFRCASGGCREAGINLALARDKHSFFSSIVYLDLYKGHTCSRVGKDTFKSTIYAFAYIHITHTMCSVLCQQGGKFSILSPTLLYNM